MRIAEALSKMKLQPFATEADVEEALRLFQVSTLDAALSGTLSGGQTWGHGLGTPWAGCVLPFCICFSPVYCPSPQGCFPPGWEEVAFFQTLGHSRLEPVHYA